MSQSEIQELLEESRCFACFGGSLSDLMKLALLKRIADGGGGGGASMVYRAIVNQESADAPVATVLENSLPGTPVWARTGSGFYTMTLAGVFLADKTWVNLAAFSFYGFAFTDTRIQFKRTSNDVLTFSIPDEGIPPDGTMSRAMIEVRVYP